MPLCKARGGSWVSDSRGFLRVLYWFRLSSSHKSSQVGFRSVLFL